MSEKKSKKFNDIKEIKVYYQSKIVLISNDLQLIRQIVVSSKQKKMFPFYDSNEDMKIFLAERKDEKYAALVMELAATLEHFLKAIYNLEHKKTFSYNRENQDKGAIIEKLELELSKKYSKNNFGKLKDIYKVRNEIAHQEFSLKSGKAIIPDHHKHKYYSKRSFNTEIKSSNLLTVFLEEATNYINSIEE